MLWLIAVVMLITLVVYVVVYVFDREDARLRADEFIAGIRKPTPEEIDKCMLRLEVANIRLLSNNETDHRRVERLRDMLKEMITPHT
jgi:hypothetical protein